MIQTVITLGVMLALDWRLTIVAVPLAPVFGRLRHHYRVLRKNSDAVRDASGV